MEDMDSLWSYQENVDELKQKLLYTTFELLSVREEASEEMRKNKEYVQQLLQLLKVACQERDEAKHQLQKLLNKFMNSSPQSEPFHPLHQLQSDGPLIKPSKANSSITESNSLSDTYNYHSHGSSTVDSIFEAASSPELSNINGADSSNPHFVPSPIISPKVDQGLLVINNIVKGKALPQKGKLLQAVLEAGPLLQTLLVAGPLPQWRNPPPLQTFHIPPVALRGCDAELGCDQKLLNCSPSMLHFASGLSGSCLGGGRLIPAASAGGYVAAVKRQRLQ